MGDHICIVGGGAIGGSIAAGLARAGLEPVVADPWYHHVEAIRARGLTVRATDGELNVPIRAIHLDELRRLRGPIDLAIVAVKSYDTEWICRAILPYLAPDAAVVSAQNGVNEDLIASIVGPERTVGAVVHIAAALMEPSVVTRFSRSGWMSLTLGALDAAGAAQVERVSEALAAAGRIETTGNIRGIVWSKLMANCMINGLSGVSGFTTPNLFLEPAAHPLMFRIGAETVAAARAAGVAMDPIELTGSPGPLDPALVLAACGGDEGGVASVGDWMRQTAQARSGASENISSLLQDVQKGRRTEIDYLNGHVVAVAGEHGSAAPCCAAVVEAVHRLSAGTLRQDPANVALVARLAAGEVAA